MPEYLYGRHTAVCKRDRAPLRHTRAGYRTSAAILCEIRILESEPMGVSIEILIGKLTDIGEHRSALAVILIDRSRVCNIVRISPAPVPFRVYSV
jgi:hypothetical protein